MAPSPIPAPLPPWAKAILWVAPMVGGYLYDLVTHADDAPTDLAWRKLMVRTKTTATGSVVQDDAFCTWDLINITGGNVDTSWTTGDYTTAETAFDAFFNSIKTYIAGHGTISEYRWYTRRFNDLGVTKPFQDSGPPQRVTTKTIAGTGTSGGVAQATMSLTERTAWPKHWGRVYLPFTSMDAISGVRWSNTACDAVAAAANTLYNALATAELFPVVAVTQVDKQPSRGLITVDHVTIDNVPDIIRHRRPRNTTYRKTLP